LTETKSCSSTWILALLASVVFLAVVNGTMINIALPYIGRDFAVTEGTYGWIVTGYSLAFGIFSAINGRLADVVGMKRLYLVGILIFGAGAAIVAVSPTIEFAIVVRFLQGAGAAALPVLGSSIIARIVPPQGRGAAMGIILSTVGVAASIGPFLGGFLVQLGGWRLVFIFTAVVLFAIPVAWRLLPAELDKTESTHFDATGAVLLSVAMILGMYGFEIVEEVGVGLNLALCLGSALVVGLGFWWWIHRAREPFVAPELLKNVRYLATTFVAFLCNATRFGTIVLVPIFLTEVDHLEPIWIGVVLFPGAIAIAVLSRPAGRLADRVGPKIPVAVGTIFIVAGNLIAAYFAGSSPIGVGVGMTLYGVGFACMQSPLIASVSIIAPSHMTGVALGMFMMIFFIGGAFGTALSVTAVELQQKGASSWLGLPPSDGALYSNAILLLTILAVLGAGLVPLLPRGRLQAAPG
jgi:EmrB/QacA subfamily drug resistance transporter